MGRFELRRVLRHDTQVQVWLGFDARSEREVVAKLFSNPTLVNSDDEARWLLEARKATRLAHSNIACVLDVGTHEGRPFLVFERLMGRTLDEELRSKGALSPHVAVAITLAILGALQAAHEAGVVHGDLKPSSVLLDDQGRVRVMDFCSAQSALADGSGARILGTPGYLAPESAAGLPLSPAVDVFAAGLLLAELLCGQAVVDASDPVRAIHRVIHEDLWLPEALGAEGDHLLLAITMRALARDPARRFASAEEFVKALQEWVQPTAGMAAEADPTVSSSTLDFLLRRMRHKSDFPALSDAVTRIQRVANSDTENLNSLANEILKDVALTNKLLRLVNTASYLRTGTGNVSTVSRAAALVGFAGIRNMALSLMLLEHMKDKAHADLLKEEFLRALMAGTLASELCGDERSREEAFIGSMFQNLGRLLAEFYFPEEAQQIRALVGAGKPAGDASRMVTDESASLQVLGLGFESLGVGVAKSWGLPDTLQRCMRRSGGDPPTRVPDNSADRMRWLGMAANELTDTLLRSDPAASDAAVTHAAERYARVLGTTVREVCEATATARVKLAESARAMGLSFASTSPAMKLLASGTGAAAPQGVDLESLAAHALMPVAAGRSAALDAQAPPSNLQAADILAAGIHDITDSMVENFKLNEVLRMILETMYRALRFRRVIFCLRDPKTGLLTGRFGLGEGVEASSAAFRVDLKDSTDLFAAVCAQGSDTLIQDATSEQMAKRLPAWYASTLNAPTFLLLPLMMKGCAFGLIYADQANASGIELAERELSLLRTLRNQAIMAFKQAV